MMRRLLTLLFLLFAWPLFAQADEALAVAQVINGNSFTLASGDTIRLASIEVPDTHSWGAQAKASLEQLLAGHKVRVENTTGKRDRHNRIIGQAYRDDGLWIQGEMLKAGLAMVYSFPEDPHVLILKMLAAENQARQAKRGIWSDPYFRVLTPQETGQFIGQFRLVEGKVTSVNDYHGHTYINFSDRWKGTFAVFIPRQYAAAFAPLNPHSLVGKTIRVRGWINYHNAPNIDLTHPEQIEME